MEIFLNSPALNPMMNKRYLFFMSLVLIVGVMFLAELLFVFSLDKPAPEPRRQQDIVFLVNENVPEPLPEANLTEQPEIPETPQGFAALGNVFNVEEFIMLSGVEEESKENIRLFAQDAVNFGTNLGPFLMKFDKGAGTILSIEEGHDSRYPTITISGDLKKFLYDFQKANARSSYQNLYARMQCPPPLYPTCWDIAKKYV